MHRKQFVDFTVNLKLFLGAVYGDVLRMQNQTADADEHRCAKSQTSPQVVAQTLRNEQAPPTPDHTTQPVRDDSQDAARTEAARVKAKFPERIDTARAITLRFDFGTNQDTRVGLAPSHASGMLFKTAHASGMLFKSIVYIYIFWCRLSCWQCTLQLLLG